MEKRLNASLLRHASTIWDWLQNPNVAQMSVFLYLLPFILYLHLLTKALFMLSLCCTNLLIFRRNPRTQECSFFSPDQLRICRPFSVYRQETTLGPQRSWETMVAPKKAIYSVSSWSKNLPRWKCYRGAGKPCEVF